MYKLHLLGFMAVFSVPALFSFGQSVEDLFYVRRGSISFQGSADLIIPIWNAGIPEFSWATVFGIDFGIANGGASLVKVSGPPYPDGVPMDMMDQNPWEYEYEVGHSDPAEFEWFIVPGTYTFRWKSAMGGSRSESVELGAYSALTPPKCANYDDLQAVDPEEAVKIEWEPFSLPSEQAGFIEVSVLYVQDWNSWDTRFLWSTEEMATSGFGLDPDLLAIDIPPHVLLGSPNNRYLVSVMFVRIDSMVETEINPGKKGVATSAQTKFFIETKAMDPGRIILPNQDWLYCEMAGWVYGFTPDWGYSHCMGWVFLGYTPNYIYQGKLGWLTPAPGLISAGRWFYSHDHGWIFINENYGGWYQDGAGTWGNLLDP